MPRLSHALAFRKPSDGLVAVRATRTIVVSTGVIPVVRVPAADVIAVHTELEDTNPGRFVVGLGGAHGPHPIGTLNAYLDELDAVGIGDRVLAALGPNMLALARNRARGAYPFLVTAQGGYRRNLLRQGFTTADIDTVSDRLLDGIAAWGSPGRIAERIAEYGAAGADQVVLRILGVDDLAMWRTRLADTLLS